MKICRVTREVLVKYDTEVEAVDEDSAKEVADKQNIWTAIDEQIESEEVEEVTSE